MSKGIIYGVGETEFTNDRGQKVHGFNLYFGVKSKKVTGTITDKKFFSFDDSDFLELIKPVGNNANNLINKMVDIEYNQKGKVDSMTYAGGEIK